MLKDVFKVFFYQNQTIKRWRIFFLSSLLKLHWTLKNRHKSKDACQQRLLLGALDVVVVDDVVVVAEELLQMLLLLVAFVSNSLNRRFRRGKSRKINW